ncbi:MAG: hypothetical protein JWP87_1481 [Labilithrix sp.]|nr:hypothetical protein [Labilithrix sp.]
MKTRAVMMGRIRRCAAALVLGAALFGLASSSVSSTAGCSSPDTSARVDPIGPDRAQFDVVAPMLVRRCGSIDCHGSPYRNMRMFGYGGTRLRDPSTATSTPETPPRSTPTEIEATYQAVIGLEPEVMRDVVKAGGAGPERLTLVRKGRNDEDHKGQQRIKHGDDADRCLLTWLASSVDVAACNAAGCVDGGVVEGLGCSE